MSCMYFQILAFPGEDTHDYVLSIKEKLLLNYQNNTNVNSIDVLRDKNVEDEIAKIPEFIINVHISFSRPVYLQFYYMKLTEIWMQISKQYPPKNRPVLLLSDDAAFSKAYITEHIIAVSSVSFGVIRHPGQFIFYESYSSRESQICNRLSMQTSFIHDSRIIEIVFNVSDDLQKMLEISYNNIRKILIKDDCCCYLYLYLDLLHPPLIYAVTKKKVNHQFLPDSVFNIKHRIVTCGVDKEVIGKANVLKICMRRNEAINIISRLYYRCGRMPMHYVNMNEVNSYSILPAIPQINLDDFACTYLFSAIFARNFGIVEQCDCVISAETLMKRLNISSKLEVKYLAKALVDILYAIDSGKIFNFYVALKSLYEAYPKVSNETSYDKYIKPENMCRVRRAILTPTRVMFYPPELMCQNRILREFEPEYALRVDFRDDNFSKLNFNAYYTEEAIFNYAVKFPLKNGIIIGNRHYQFLGWSNSQIRSHGVWLYALDSKGRTAHNVRKWMGDFSHIYAVPKFMARMGQCFSQTEATISVPLDNKTVVTEDDIEHDFDYVNSKPYCFSDGIGKISLKLAKQVHQSLGHDKECSAFQIRYSGYKGMLVIDPTLVDKDIVFRKSMLKFGSESRHLEIARTSRPTSLQLNRPFITILNQKGIKTVKFLQLQQNMLRTLTDMLLDEDKAAEYLTSKIPSNIFKCKDLSLSGIGMTTEPFFRSLLLALHRSHVEKIKTRANIAIDPSEGRNMLGVLDETGSLKYGQVFVQYTNNILLGETNRDTTILKGSVIVTKNPCLYPGDVQMLFAVDIPSLHHIIDCIVFPQNGSRPHPNEMAGSDLDGDEFAVLWEKEMLRNFSNSSPAHFPSYSTPAKNSIQEDDIINFFVDYIKNDQIGVLANAHLAWADSEGIFSSKCISIARKFSIAVDYAKSGVSAHLAIEEKPQKFPDFMEKYYKMTYNSKWALGKLYRICKDFESENQYASGNPADIQVDQFLVYPGYETYEKSANKNKIKYNRLLKTVFENYGIQSEAEAFSGAFSRLHCRYSERKDKDEVEKVIISCIETLNKNIKKEFFCEFSGNIKEVQTVMLQKASAWYIVTYSKPENSFLSFPWIVSDLLANIKVSRITESGRSLDLFLTPMFTKLEAAISKCTSILPRLPDIAYSLLHPCIFYCNREIVKTALCILIMWAIGEKIIFDSNSNQKGFLHTETFIRLFLHVADMLKYISNKGLNVKSKVAAKCTYTCTSLILSFLHFCVTLRFYNKKEVGKYLPFQVYKYKELSRRAMQTYHSIAILGYFPLLRCDTDHYFDSDDIEMTPIYIESNIFWKSPVLDTEMKQAEMALLSHTGAKWVNMREIRDTKKVIVNAVGKESSIKQLKSVLRKKRSVLRELFTTGTVDANIL